MKSHPASRLRVNKSLKSLRVYLLEFLGPWASAVESQLSLLCRFARITKYEDLAVSLGGNGRDLASPWGSD